MSKMKVPSAWTTAAAAKDDIRPRGDKAKVEAGVATAGVVDMSEEVAGQGLCPVCRKEMVESQADGNYVRVCMDHRIALPLSDEEIEAKTKQQPQ
ncbi:hypothetical protein [Burkholderia phage BCSR5]|nr:hypothetical protein [Burkholderia phage BCSR5]